MAATIEQIAKELRETNGSGVGDDTEHLEELSSNMAEMTDLMVRDFNMTQRIANTEQERERDLFTTLISTFENKINELIEFMRGDSLRDLEQRREEAMAARAEQRRAAAGPERQVDDKETGILGRLTGGLIADAKALIAPIMSTLGMLVKGGVIALVIGGLFLLFKTIRDNPVFLETVETIKDIWQNSIVPTFNDIRQSIIDFMETPAFDRIIEIMNDVRIAIQNFVSRTLGTLVETLSGVFEGIASIIEGITTFDLSKIVGGVNNIIGSLVSGFVSAVDNVITAVLEMFGVSFKDDATLFEAITMGVSRFFSGLRESVANIFSSVVGWIRNQLGFSEGEMPSILDVITGIYTAPVDLLRSAASWITGKLGFDSISQFLEDLSFADMLRSIVMAPFNLLRGAFGWIKNQLGFNEGQMPSIKDIFIGILTAPATLLRNAANWILGKFGLDDDMIPDPKDILMAIITAPFRILENIRDWIADKVSGLGAIVSRLIPSPLKNLLGIGSNDDETEEDSVAKQLPDKVTDLANVSRGLLSGTADAVGETASNIRDSVGGFVGGLFDRDNNNDDEDDESVQVSGRSRRGRSRGNDSTDIESVDIPSRVAAARTLERSADERSQAQQEAAATPPTQSQRSGQQGGNVNISSTNVSAGVIRNRPPASGVPDNASDAAFGLSVAP